MHSPMPSLEENLEARSVAIFRLAKVLTQARSLP